MNKFTLKHIISYSTIVCGLIFTASCANTKLTSTWMDEKKSGSTYNDILIIGIAEHEHNRRLFEEEFYKQLGNMGIESEVSYSILPKSTDINRDTVTAAIKGKDIDAIIITHMIGIEEQTVYRQSMNYMLPRGYYNGLYSYYPQVHTYVNQPGYYTTHDIVKLETNLYEVNSEELVWSAQSQSFAPESAKEVVDDLIKLVIKDLKSKGLIAVK